MKALLIFLALGTLVAAAWLIFFQDNSAVPQTHGEEVIDFNTTSDLIVSNDVYVDKNVDEARFVIYRSDPNVIYVNKDGDLVTAYTDQNKEICSARGFDIVELASINPANSDYLYVLKTRDGRFIATTVEDVVFLNQQQDQVIEQGNYLYKDKDRWLYKTSGEAMQFVRMFRSIDKKIAERIAGTR